MNAALHEAIQQCGLTILASQPLSGGMINKAARLETNGGTFFIKLNNNAPSGLFEREVEGLRALAATNTVRVPEVFHLADAAPPNPAFLILEWIESAPPRRQFTRRFAEDLANLHQGAAPNSFGWHNDNYLGELRQINTREKSWRRFYREYRLKPQIELARERKLLPARRATLLNQILEKLDNLLDDFEPKPALLHGDLWSGNFIATGDNVVLIDPAVYFGEREMEIAFIELFGSFPTDFVETYHQIFPLDKGYEKRRPLHQLYPLLVHLNHFGETYGLLLDNTCRQILAST